MKNTHLVFGTDYDPKSVIVRLSNPFVNYFAYNHKAKVHVKNLGTLYTQRWDQYCDTNMGSFVIYVIAKVYNYELFYVLFSLSSG